MDTLGKQYSENRGLDVALEQGLAKFDTRLKEPILVGAISYAIHVVCMYKLS